MSNLSLYKDYDIFAIAWIFAGLMFVVGDSITTIYGLENRLMIESNIYMRILINEFGYLVFFLVKVTAFYLIMKLYFIFVYFNSYEKLNFYLEWILISLIFGLGFYATLNNLWLIFTA